jgi:sensor histidine kinase YesM
MHSTTRKRIIILGSSVALLAVIYFLYSIFRFKADLFAYVAVLWILLVILILWTGNRFIDGILARRFPWTTYMTRRFYLQLAVSVVFSLSIVNLTYYVLKPVLLGSPSEARQYVILNLYGLLLILPVITINFGMYFLSAWKKTLDYSKKLEQENLQSKLASLQSHIDPHFLFNSMNILSTLIEKDSRSAIEYLENFSDIYRYILDYKGSELVSLRTELEALESYFYILEKRYAAGLIIDVSIQEELHDKYILPLGIQMLVENAVKHNITSEKHPLRIEIMNIDAKTLQVRNNLQIRNRENDTMDPTGLKNIVTRYEYLTETPVRVIQDDSLFTVLLPILDG